MRKDCLNLVQIFPRTKQNTVFLLLIDGRWSIWNYIFDGQVKRNRVNFATDKFTPVGRKS